MNKTRTVIKETPSGPIELVWDQLMRLEFNGSCMDMLSSCQAACCRYRAGWSVEIDKDEIDKYQCEPHPLKEGAWILASNKRTMECVYLDSETSLCTIHDRKPRGCQNWGCSPGTEKDDPRVERREVGWALTPLLKNEAELVQIKF